MPLSLFKIGGSTTASLFFSRMETQTHRLPLTLPCPLPAELPLGDLQSHSSNCELEEPIDFDRLQINLQNYISAWHMCMSHDFLFIDTRCRMSNCTSVFRDGIRKYRSKAATWVKLGPTQAWPKKYTPHPRQMRTWSKLSTLQNVISENGWRYSVPTPNPQIYKSLTGQICGTLNPQFYKSLGP